MKDYTNNCKARQKVVILKLVKRLEISYSFELVKFSGERQGCNSTYCWTYPPNLLTA